jgi:hypothetical protein
MRKIISLIPRPALLVCCLILCSLFISCSDEPNSAKVSADTDKLLSTLNIENAQSIFYKEAGSRATDDTGFYKIDYSGNEVKLQIANKDGVPQPITISWCVKASDDFLFFHPETWDVYDALGLDGVSQNEEIMDAISMVCLVEKSTGKIFKMPYCNMAPNTVAKVQNNYIGILGDRTGSWGIYQQIYMFNPEEKTISSILPEGQEFAWFDINQNGFVGYCGNYSNPLFKIKCPGGAIRVFQEPTFLLSENFYTIDEGKVYLLEPNGDNDFVKKVVCDSPSELGDKFQYNSQRKTYVFNNFEFNGRSFNELPHEIGYEFLTASHSFSPGYFYETKLAWYVLTGDKLIKLRKSDYDCSEVALTQYQILEVVSDVNQEYLSFVGIRYSDSKKVVGKITSDDSFVIESAMPGDQQIYNLIPLN